MPSMRKDENGALIFDKTPEEQAIEEIKATQLEILKEVRGLRREVKALNKKGDAE